MASRQDSDRAKAQQEKFQAILSAMLKDEDNKYCEDCDAKGPRWASWNLGIFLCIRCAGIHRNLGVHISKVKSVNLDSWTPEQVAMMQEMGNSRARAVYEANVPDHFRRPQSNSAIEAFIRSKYEVKKYIAREWVPPKPVVPKEWFEDDRTEKKKPRSKVTSSTSTYSVTSTVPSASVQSRASTITKPAVGRPAEPQAAPQPQPVKVSSATEDLLGLDTEIVSKTGASQQGDLLSDLFGGSPSVSAAQPAQSSTFAPQQERSKDQSLFPAAIKSTGTNGGASAVESTAQCQPSAPKIVPVNDRVTNMENGSVEPSFFEKVNNDGGGEEKKSTKDSIMALYGSGGVQSQVFGVPGVVAMSTPQDGNGPSNAWTGNPFMYPDASFYQMCYVAAASPHYYSSAGGMYMPQQQMLGNGGMAPMMQQQVMMGMQPGMMGQTMQQGMMGMTQPSGAMYSGMQTGGQGMMMNAGGQGMMNTGGHGMMNAGGQGMMNTGGHGMMNAGGQGMMNTGGHGMMNAGGQGMMNAGGQGMMNTGGQGMMNAGGQGMMTSGSGGYMQQQFSQSPMAQQFNPMQQQQMQFQQMQQQMAGMMLGGSQMTGMQQQQQQPQQAAVGWGSWDGSATGHTLSHSLWQ